MYVPQALQNGFVSDTVSSGEKDASLPRDDRLVQSAGQRNDGGSTEEGSDEETEHAGGCNEVSY